MGGSRINISEKAIKRRRYVVVQLGPIGFRWVPLGSVGFRWVPLGPIGFHRVPSGPPLHSLFSLGLHLRPEKSHQMAMAHFCYSLGRNSSSLLFTAKVDLWHPSRSGSTNCLLNLLKQSTTLNLSGLGLSFNSNI